MNKTILLSVVLTVSVNSFALGTGEFKGSTNGYELYASVSNAGKIWQKVSLLIDGRLSCGGTTTFIVVAGKDSVSGSPGDGCEIQLTQNGSELSVSEGSGCSFYHGSACSYDGELRKIGDTPKTEDYYKRRTAENTEKMLDAVNKISSEKLTLIESPRPARIVIDGEYVGNTPMRVDLAQYFDGAISLWIKAMPITSGCVQSEPIYSGRRMPKRMYFDTDLCNH